jgi:glycosyltransferase involved in cell wall biosynthesis
MQWCIAAMRIVMLTDDVQIDRRIVQEAQSLITQGHEVILLAGWQEGLPEFERIGQVKIERLRHPQFPVRLRVIYALQGRVIRSLNWVSRGGQWLIGRVSLAWHKLITLWAQAINRIYRALISGLNVVSRGGQWLIGRVSLAWQKLITLCAQGVNLLSKLCARVVLWRGLRVDELALLAGILRYQPDVIHTHDLPYLKAAMYAKRRIHVPLVYDAHELYPEIATLSPQQRRTLTRIERRLVPLCDHVITVNPFIASEMAKRYHIPLPTVILNATDRPQGFDPTQHWNRFRECLAIPSSHSILLYQGWISLTRGLQNLIRAMRCVDVGIHLVVMGYGEAIDELKWIRDNLGLADRVHFKNAVPQTELLFWTASAEAGIIPYQPIDLNNYYCSPNKLFEFIQAGVPIIGNDLPFLSKVIGGEGFGIVSKLETIEDYAKAIQLMFDPQLGGPARFVERLLTKAGSYTWQKEEKKLLTLYQKIIHTTNG